MKTHHLVVVGKCREPACRALAEGYLQRLRRYCCLQVHELRDQGPQDEAVRQRAWMTKAPPGAAILLTEEGRPLDSSAWARAWEDLPEGAVFFLGGPDGFAPDLRAEIRQQWSLSPLTLPHELARVVFLEQAYRACTILAGHPYHRSG